MTISVAARADAIRKMMRNWGNSFPEHSAARLWLHNAYNLPDGVLADLATRCGVLSEQWKE